MQLFSAIKCFAVFMCSCFFTSSSSKRYAKHLRAVLICFRRQGHKLQIDFLFINFMECGSCLKHIFCARQGRQPRILPFSVKGGLPGFFPSHFHFPVNLGLSQYYLSSVLQKKKKAALAGSVRVQLNYSSICEKHIQ